MKKLTLLILAFLLLVAASYYLYLRAPAENSGPVPDLVALAPREAEWIAFLDLAAWRSSPMLDQLQQLVPVAQEDPEYRRFVSETGFDYSRDLDRAVLALFPAPTAGSAGPADYQPLAIAEGRFQRERITAHALRNGSRESHAGLEIFLVRERSSPRASEPATGQTLLAFLTGTRVAIADAGESALHASRARTLILQAAQSPPGNASLSPLAERAARVSGAPFFIVGQGTALRQLNRFLDGTNPLAAQSAQVLSGMQWITFAARPEENRIRISILGECQSTWQATQLGLLLDGLQVLARTAIQDPQTRKGLSARELEQVEATLATIRVERRGQVVELRLEVSAEALALVALGNRGTELK